MISNCKSMIWDFDGTLVDTYPVMARSLLTAIREVGVESDYDEVYKQLKVSLSAAIDHFAKGDTVIKLKIRQKFEALERAEDPNAYEVFWDTIETLKKLKAEGIKHYILTHRNASTLKIMEAKGMTDLIEDVVISDDGFKRKPDPEAFTHLIEKHQLSREQTISIGDRLFDVEAGRNAGIRGCLIIDAYNSHLVNEVDYAVNNRSEIINLLEG